MLADLIAHDRGPDSGLRSFIRNFMSVIEFDAHRHGRIASSHELAAYTTCLATAVMDGLQYFIGNGHPYPKTHDRDMAVTGAHITHMLRDMLEDLSTGLVNIPAEYLEAHGIDLTDEINDQLRPWVRDQVELARYCFQEGKTYIDSLEVLRCKLAGVWYCARFECVLNAIERDGYRLREEYPERHALEDLAGDGPLGGYDNLEAFRPSNPIFFHSLWPSSRTGFLTVPFPVRRSLNPHLTRTIYSEVFFRIRQEDG